LKEEIFSLQTMLKSLYKVNNGKVQKRILFDQAPIGGIGRIWVILFFISLPILLFAGIFNPTVFAMLGIAQAIIFYIVFLSMVMIMVIALTFINNNKVIRQITPSWKALFPTVDLKQVLSSGTTAYTEFLPFYSELLRSNVDEATLVEKFKDKFMQMQTENKEIFEAMNRDLIDK